VTLLVLRLKFDSTTFNILAKFSLQLLTSSSLTRYSGSNIWNFINKHKFCVSCSHQVHMPCKKAKIKMQ